MLFILLLPIILATTASYQYISQRNVQLIPFENYPMIGQYVPYYLFYGSLVFVVLLIICIFIIIFFPNKRQTLQFKKGNGVLKIEKKAIDNFVLTSIKKENYVHDPKVKTKIKRHKIIIMIKGHLLNYPDIEQQNAAFTSQLQQDLEQLLGITEDKKIYVHLTNYVPKVKTSSRVE